MITIQLCDAPTAPNERGTIYLPIVMTVTDGHVEPPPGDTPEATFFGLLTSDKRQRRPSLIWSASLVEAAKWRARDIIDGNYWNHCDPFGVCPNLVARRFGCKLPDSYDDHANNIESLAAGSPNAAVVFAALAGSPSHRAHLFGEGDFFRQQMHVGIALATGGQWGFVWCVLIGICEEV